MEQYYFFFFDVGIAKCGNVETLVLVNDLTKTVTVLNPDRQYLWKNGDIIGDRFGVQYAGFVKLQDDGYKMQFKDIPEEEYQNAKNNSIHV